MGYNKCPKNVLPIPPVATWRDLHFLVNQLFLKIANQSQRQKTILAVESEALEDGERIVGANDGQAIRVDSVDRIKEIRFGGPDQQNIGMMLQAKQLFSWTAGNLDTLGGLAPGSETAKQDQLMAGQSNERLTSMQDEVKEFVNEIVRHLAFYLWSDPFLEMTIVYKMEEEDIAVPYNWTEEDRTCDFIEFNLDIVAYTLVPDTPQDKLEKFMMWLNNGVGAMAPYIEAQGGQVDAKFVLDYMAELLNIEEIKGVVKFQEQEDDENMPIGNAPTKPTSNAIPQNQNRSRAAAVVPQRTKGGSEGNVARSLLTGGQGMNNDEMQQAERQLG